MKHTPHLKKYYTETVVPALKTARGYKNHLEVPRLSKIVLNTGINSAADKNQIADCQRDLGLVAGQKAVTTKSRKAVANFKLREGQTIGAMVTLRGDNMWEFLYRLIAIALPTIRDFRGVSPRLDGQGNYSIGIADITIFPEIPADGTRKHMGLDVSIVTTAGTDDEGRELLRLLGMPFRRPEAAKPGAPAKKAHAPEAGPGEEARPEAKPAPAA